MSTKFIGEKKLLEEHLNFSSEVKGWVNRGEWDKFRSEHFDWWAFPVDLASGFGDKYKVDIKTIESLKQSKDFIESLEYLINTLLASWGWRDEGYRPVNDIFWDKKYIRLWKMWRSAYIFGLAKSEIEILFFARFIQSKLNGDFYYKDQNLYFDFMHRMKELDILYE